MNPKLSNNPISNKAKGKLVVFVNEKDAFDTIFDVSIGEVMHRLREWKGHCDIYALKSPTGKRF